MYQAQTLFNNYLRVLIHKGITIGRCISSLFNNLKEFGIVDKELDNTTYLKLVVAVKNEWNSIKDSI